MSTDKDMSAHNNTSNLQSESQPLPLNPTAQISPTQNLGDSNLMTLKELVANAAKLKNSSNSTQNTSLLNIANLMNLQNNP